MPPTKRIPEPDVSNDLRSLRILLGRVAEACAEGATKANIITDRNRYARCLSHIAAAIAELPES